MGKKRRHLSKGDKRSFLLFVYLPRFGSWVHPSSFQMFFLHWLTSVSIECKLIYKPGVHLINLVLEQCFTFFTIYSWNERYIKYQTYECQQQGIPTEQIFVSLSLLLRHYLDQKVFEMSHWLGSNKFTIMRVQKSFCGFSRILFKLEQMPIPKIFRLPWLWVGLKCT